MSRLAYNPPGADNDPPVAPTPPDAFAEWKAGLTPDAYGWQITSDVLAPALRRNWFVIVQPGAEPVAGDYVAIAFKNGQRFVLELVRKTPQFVQACTPFARRAFRQFPAADIASLELVAAIVPPSCWPVLELSQQEVAHDAER